MKKNHDGWTEVLFMVCMFFILGVTTGMLIIGFINSEIPCPKCPETTAQVVYIPCTDMPTLNEKIRQAQPLPMPTRISTMYRPPMD